MDNRAIAAKLIGLAHDLEKRHRSLYRVRAYRKAAETVMGLTCPVEEILRNQGRKGLKELPGIGSHISETIEELVQACDDSSAPSMN